MDEYVKLDDVMLVIKTRIDQLMNDREFRAKADAIDLHGLIPMIQLLSTHRMYTEKEVAGIIAEIVGDDCACNVNGNDEWLSSVCELQDKCPNPGGAKCWEQFLKHKV